MATGIRERVVLTALNDLGGKARTKDIADVLECSPAHAGTVLKEMSEAGLVTKDGWTWSIRIAGEEFAAPSVDEAPPTEAPEVPEVSEFPGPSPQQLRAGDIAAARQAIDCAQLLLERYDEDELMARVNSLVASIDDVLEYVYHGESPSVEQARTMILKGFDYDPS